MMPELVYLVKENKMSLKLYIAFVIVFVCSGIAIQDTLVKDDQDKLSDNAIIEAIKKLIEQISALEKEAIKQFSNGLEKLITFVNDTLSKVSKEVTSTIGKFVEEIVVLEDKAIKLGVNISSCAVNKSIEELKTIPDKILNETINCTDAVVYSASDYVDKAVLKINYTINGVKELLEEASKCGLNPVCWAELDVKIVEKTATVPLEITAIITDTIKLLTKLGAEVTKCAITYAAEATEEGFTITKNVTTCINNAIKK